MKNLFDQEIYARRGENDGRLATLATDLSALDTRLDTAEAELALIETGVWTTFSPVITQTATITHTDTWSRWTRIGRTIIFDFSFALTSAGTAGAAFGVGLPVAAAAAGSTGIGSGQFYDASANTRYVCVFELASATSFVLIHDTSAGNVFGAVPGVTIASGDSVRGSVTYEAAS